MCHVRLAFWRQMRFKQADRENCILVRVVSGNFTISASWNARAETYAMHYADTRFI
jgi:hypothetical protein